MFQAQPKVRSQAELGKTIHDTSVKIITSIDLDARNQRNLLIAGMFYRVANSHKAFLREACFGYWAEAETTGRPIYEALILMAELIRNPAFEALYILSQNKLSAKFADAYVRDAKRAEPALVKLKIPDFDPAKLLEILKEQGYGHFDLSKLAIENDLVQTHDLGYTLLHSSVHVKPNSLRRHFEVENATYRICQLPWEPNGDLLAGQVNLAVLEAQRRILLYFNLVGFADRVQEASDRLAKLLPSTKNR